MNILFQGFTKVAILLVAFSAFCLSSDFNMNLHGYPFSLHLHLYFNVCLLNDAGFSLFLGLMIDRLHHYIREIRLRRKNMEMGKKQNRGFEDGKISVPEETKTFEEEISTLRSKIVQLESELEKKNKELNTAEANAIALRKQSEGFLLEYDRLLEDNQNLRSQLQSLDWRLSHSGSKKNT